jgi:uncharacterized protein YijF (DUF1287 family)
MFSRRDFLFCAAALPAARFACVLPPYSNLAYHARNLVLAAEAQIGVTLLYDGAYVRIAYPGGDVPPERGVCCDVIVRAYRAGLGIDLQKLVHEDMAAHFPAYPALWGLRRPDANIDHRRVPNLAAFLRRQGAELPREARLEPGDVVTQVLPGNLPHIALVSGENAPGSDRFQVIHNIGRGTEFSDVLERFPVTGRFRWRPEVV